MTFFLLQTALLMLGAFLLGALASCLIRRTFFSLPAESAGTYRQTDSLRPAVAASAAAAAPAAMPQMPSAPVYAPKSAPMVEPSARPAPPAAQPAAPAAAASRFDDALAGKTQQAAPPAAPVAPVVAAPQAPKPVAAPPAPPAPAVAAPQAPKPAAAPVAPPPPAPVAAAPVVAAPVVAAPMAPKPAAPVMAPAPVVAAPKPLTPAAPVAPAPAAPVVPAPQPVVSKPVAPVPAATTVAPPPPAPAAAAPSAAPAVAAATAAAAAAAAAAVASAAHKVVLPAAGGSGGHASMVAPAAAAPVAPAPVAPRPVAPVVAAPAAPAPVAPAAPKAAEPVKPVAPAAPSDLTRIRGIDEAMAKRLNVLGVMRYADIASWTAADVTRHSATLGIKGRIEQQNWIEQAQILAKGGLTDYAMRLPVGAALPTLGRPTADTGTARAFIVPRPAAAATAPAAPVSAAAPAPVAAAPVAPTPTAAPTAATAAAGLAAAAAAAAAAAGAVPKMTVAQPVPAAPVAPAPQAPAPQAAAAAAPAAPLPADDLTRIRAIDGGLQQRLQQLGVRRYADIASWRQVEVDRIAGSLGLGKRITQENWIEQAQILSKGGETDYSRRLKAAAGSLVAPPAAVATAPPAPKAPVAPVMPAAPVVAAPPAAPVAAPAVAPAAAAPVVAPVAVAAAPVAAASAVAAAATGSAPGFSGDDLTRIRGIDGALQQRLNQLGARRFADIAMWRPADVDRIGGGLGLGNRVMQENWIEQAQILAKGGETDYSRRHKAGAPATAGAYTSLPTAGTASAPAAAPPAPTTGTAGAFTSLPQAGTAAAGAVATAAAAAAATVAGAARAAVEAEPRPAKLVDAIREQATKTAAVAPRADLSGLRSVRSEGLLRGTEGVRPGAAMDDLKRIRGIGVLIEKKLNSLGITSYDQVANWSGNDIDRISQLLDFKGRIERENWIEQARILASGGQTEFSRRVDRGEVDSSRNPKG